MELNELCPNVSIEINMAACAVGGLDDEQQEEWREALTVAIDEGLEGVEPR